MKLIDAYKLLGNLIAKYNDIVLDHSFMSLEEKQIRCKLLKEVIVEVERQPQVNNTWIPCKERLPKLETHYTSKTVAILIDWNLDSSFLEVATGKLVNDTWFGYTVSGDRIDIVDNEKIIAWQPLPKPYEGKENEKQG